MQQNKFDNGKNSVFQVALLQSLTQGYYDGIITVGDLKKHGDTGIGTFYRANGEMILLDGKMYQALGDGIVIEADDSETVPFSVVTFFNKDVTVKLSAINSINELMDELAKTVVENGKNLFYFIKINTTFKKINVRSLLKQNKPYRSLDKALETDQRLFNYENIKGTATALYCPDYMGGLNMPGFHMHFVSDDKTKGGHILDLAFDCAEADFSIKQGFEMCLPESSDFQSLELSKDVSEAIKKIETNE